VTRLRKVMLEGLERCNYSAVHRGVTCVSSSGRATLLQTVGQSWSGPSAQLLGLSAHRAEVLPRATRSPSRRNIFFDGKTCPRIDVHS
jgi:hypothetical protein